MYSQFFLWCQGSKFEPRTLHILCVVSTFSSIFNLLSRRQCEDNKKVSWEFICLGQEFDRLGDKLMVEFNIVLLEK